VLVVRGGRTIAQAGSGDGEAFLSCLLVGGLELGRELLKSRDKAGHVGLVAHLALDRVAPLAAPHVAHLLQLRNLALHLLRRNLGLGVGPCRRLLGESPPARQSLPCGRAGANATRIITVFRVCVVV
jgi:hypothetical protein